MPPNTLAGILPPQSLTPQPGIHHQLSIHQQQGSGFTIGGGGNSLVDSNGGMVGINWLEDRTLKQEPPGSPIPQKRARIGNNGTEDWRAQPII